MHLNKMDSSIIGSFKNFKTCQSFVQLSFQSMSRKWFITSQIVSDNAEIK